MGNPGEKQDGGQEKGEVMSDAEKLANDIALISSQLENVSDCTRLYIVTASDKKPQSKENSPHEGCFEELKETIRAVLQKHRAKLIIELAEASGMRPDDDRLALEGEAQR
jgi:hypothetical protein